VVAVVRSDVVDDEVVVRRAEELQPESSLSCEMFPAIVLFVEP
jgi:hypothetical protein